MCVFVCVCVCVCKCVCVCVFVCVCVCEIEIWILSLMKHLRINTLEYKNVAALMADISQVYLTLRTHCVWKFLKIWRQFCSTSLLCSSKIVLLNDRNLARFTWNLVQKLMGFFLTSKNSRKWPKLANAYIVRKNPYTCILETKG